MNDLKRRIKFRAWDPINKNIFDLVLYDRTKQGQLITTLNDYLKAVEMDGSVVMQYTGLKDKNGKEIYEGDIVTNEWTRIDGKSLGQKWTVKYGEYDNSDIEYGSGGHIGFYVDPMDPKDIADGPEGLHNLPTDDDSRLPKVIGNIYETPELLEDKNEEKTNTKP